MCAVGPGSFTGLRIGLSTAKGLARGAGADFIGIPSLDAYAAMCNGQDGYVLPVIDARKGNFYGALYKGEEKVHPESDLSNTQLLDLVPRDETVFVTGPDCDMFKELSGSKVVIDSSFSGISAPLLLELGIKRRESQGCSDSFDMGALYIRKSEAEEKLLAKTGK